MDDNVLTLLEPRYYWTLEAGMIVIKPLASPEREVLGALHLALAQNAFP